MGYRSKLRAVVELEFDDWGSLSAWMAEGATLTSEGKPGEGLSKRAITLGNVVFP